MTIKTYTRFYEGKEHSAFTLVDSNDNPVLLDGYFWLFDPYIGDTSFRVANRQIKSKGLHKRQFARCFKER